ncbi:MAG: pantetheine-phosphate adenylyltransferase [Kiritimatiellia bacterium]
MKRGAIYPGTFDPLTFGHIDLIERGAEIFDELILAVAAEAPKDTLFSTEERVAMAREVVKDMKNVSAEVFDGLLVDYVRDRNCRIVIRGLRAYSDFEYEFRMALTNRKLAPEIETLFMMPKEAHSYVSSSVVKKVARLGGDIKDFVPAAVQRHLAKRFARQ